MLDRYGYLQSITYLGSSPVEQRNFSKLVGLHESYINDLVHFYDNGLIKDLVEFFHGNWAVALYHDRFRELCQSLRLDTNEDLATHAEKIRMMAETGLSDEKLNQQRREMIGVGGAKLKPSTRESSQLALIEWMKGMFLDLPCKTFLIFFRRVSLKHRLHTVISQRIVLILTCIFYRRRGEKAPHARPRSDHAVLHHVAVKERRERKGSVQLMNIRRVLS